MTRKQTRVVSLTSLTSVGVKKKGINNAKAMHGFDDRFYSHVFRRCIHYRVHNESLYLEPIKLTDAEVIQRESRYP